MIDQIKSKIANTSKQVSNVSNKNSKSEINVIKTPEVKSDSKVNDQNISKFLAKDAVKNMSKEPPIDKINVSRIKSAIANGSYPVDLEKISDALFDAYKEMKK